MTSAGIEVSDAFKASLVPGQRVNIRRRDSSEPVIREVIKSGYIIKRAKRWFYWYWRPEPWNEGYPDPGYSGICEGDAP